MARVGIVDESTPTYRDDLVVYGLAMVLVDVEDVDIVRERLTETLNRKRSLHWESEGIVTRSNIVREVCALDVEAHVASLIVDRKQQQLARTRLLTDRLLPMACEAGAQQFLIERRSVAEDNRDRQQVRDWFRSSEYRFEGIDHVRKEEPLAWASDALSGIWTDAALGRGSGIVEQLISSRCLRSTWQG